MRLNSTGETYRYKVGVVGSIPTVATLARSSTGQMYPAFNRGVVSSNLTGPTMDEKLNGRAAVC